MSEKLNTKLDIDLSYLKDVSSGSTEFMVEMIDLFLEQTPGYFETLDQAINAEDWPRVADIAHKIKPTFVFMGLTSARDGMANVENCSRTLSDLDTVRPTFDSLYALSEQLFTRLHEVKEELLRS